MPRGVGCHQHRSKAAYCGGQEFLEKKTIIIDTLGQNDQLTNRYVAHFTVSQVYDEIIKKEHYRYLVEMENVNTGERFREFSTSFSPESNSFPPSKEMIKIKKFDETQQKFLINAINNAFIAGENNMNDPTIDHVLDFDIRLDEDNNRIKVSFDLGGREEPNLLLPSRFPTEIELDAHSFQMGDLYEASTKLSQHLYSLIRRQYFFYKSL